MQLHAPGGEHLARIEIEDLPTALPRQQAGVRRRAALLLLTLAVVVHIGGVVSSSAGRGWLLAATRGESISRGPRRNEELRARTPRMADPSVELSKSLAAQFEAWFGREHEADDSGKIAEHPAAPAAPAGVYALDTSSLAYRWYLPNAPQSVSAPNVDEEWEENVSHYAAWVQRNKLHRTEPESAEAPRKRFPRGRDVLERGWQRIRGKKVE